MSVETTGTVRGLLRPDRVPRVKGTAARRRTASAGPDGLPIDTRDPAWLRRTQPLRGACSGPRRGAVWSVLRGVAPDGAKRVVVRAGTRDSGGGVRRTLRPAAHSLPRAGRT